MKRQPIKNIKPKRKPDFIHGYCHYWISEALCINIKDSWYWHIIFYDYEMYSSEQSSDYKVGERPQYGKFPKAANDLYKEFINKQFEKHLL